MWRMSGLPESLEHVSLFFSPPAQISPSYNEKYFLPLLRNALVHAFLDTGGSHTRRGTMG